MPLTKLYNRMNRFEELKEILTTRRCFKLVCGAGNEDVEEVRKLSCIYTLAGTTMLDLSANINVVRAAKNGISTAFKLAPILGRKIKNRPYLNVSIGLKGDPHVRKARINFDLCAGCLKCISECRQEAISDNLIIKEFKCIGCGDCEKKCEFGAIDFIHKKADFVNILPACLKEGVETMELHAVIEDEDAVFGDWILLNNLVKRNYVSMCLDRFLLSNKQFIARVHRAYDMTGERFIIQADGVPMGGEGDDYNTTLQAIACADLVQKSGIPTMTLLSGGTNSKTGKLAKLCGVRANGISVGTWARKIVKIYTNNEDFDNNIDNIKEAVSIANTLIKSNIEAISG